MSFGGWRYEFVIPTIVAILVLLMVASREPSTRQNVIWAVGLWAVSTVVIFGVVSFRPSGWHLDYQGFSYGVGLAAANAIPFLAVAVAAALVRAAKVSRSVAVPALIAAALVAVWPLPWMIFGGAILSCALMGNKQCL